VLGHVLFDLRGLFRGQVGAVLDSSALQIVVFALWPSPTALSSPWRSRVHHLDFLCQRLSRIVLVSGFWLSMIRTGLEVLVAAITVGQVGRPDQSARLMADRVLAAGLATCCQPAIGAVSAACRPRACLACCAVRWRAGLKQTFLDGARLAAWGTA